MLPVILSLVLAVGGGGSAPPRATPLLLNTDFDGAAAGQHWGGMDVPDYGAVEVTGLLWTQHAPGAAGTARFEVLNGALTVVCYVDVNCADAVGTDTRATCATPYDATPGEHLNVQGNAGNTCQPSGMLQVVGTLR